MPSAHPPLAPEEHLAEANIHWTASSMPSARTTRTCATPSRTAEISSTPSRTADPSNLYHLPRHEEDPENLDSLNNRRGEEAEHSRASTEKSTSSSADMGRKKVRGSRSSTTVRYWWRPPVLPPRIDGLNTRSPSLGQISGSTSIIRASAHSSPVIRESWVKKVLVDGGSSINVRFPWTLQGLGVALKELHESDTPFFGIVPTEGEYPLGHIYMSVTFGTPENYRTEFLRFEVASFDYGYNAIIGRPGFGEVHGHSALYVHDIEDAWTARNHHCAC
jgi:hypothetical protein